MSHSLSETLNPAQLRITQEIKRFDLLALLRALFRMGYDWGDLIFSSASATHSVDSVCQQIIFNRSKVNITLNLGLLSAQSVLPSFFFKLMDNNTVGAELLEKYLHFFDHHLLQSLLQATFIEKNYGLFPSWSDAQRDYLALVGLDSLTTFALLVQLVYPDFKTRVKKEPKVVALRESAFCLGKSLSKKAILGGNATKTYTSFRTVITTDEPCYQLKTPWPIEIRRRLSEYILPLLRRIEIHLSVLLIIRGHEGRMELSPTSYLGFEPLGKRGAPFELLIYYGRAKEIKV